MATLKLVEATPSDREAWDAFVTKLECGVFSSFAWTDVLDRAFGYRPERFVARDDGGDITAVFAGSITGRGRFVAVPAAGYCNAGAINDSARNELVQHVVDVMMRANRPIHMTTTHELTIPHLAHSHSTDTFHLSTNTPYEAVWTTRITRKTRNLVRKAEKSGVEVECSHLIPDSYYPVYHDTMRRLAFPPLTCSFYRALQEELGNKISFYGAYHESRLIAGLVAIRQGDRLHVWGNASLSEARRLAPNNILYARAIEDACETDVELVDFGSSSTGSSHSHFKKGFGGEPTPIHTYSSEVVESERRQDSLREFVCRHTPLAFQNLLGRGVFKLLY